MHLRIERRQPRVPETHLTEIVTPRTNAASLTSAENLFAALAMPGPLSVEIAADQDACRFLVRTSSPSMRQQLQAQVAAAYPQAELREISSDQDPARARQAEQVGMCRLELRSAAYLPIRTFTDSDLDPQRGAQSDPLLAILGALSNLPAGWRGLSQAVLRPAAEEWCRGSARFSVQHPLAHERVARPTEHLAPTVWFVAVLLLLCVLGLQGMAWLRSGQWQAMAGTLATVGAAGLTARRIVRRLRPPVYDMQLVADKIIRQAFHVDLRLTVFAPATAPPARVEGELERLAAAYRHFNLNTGNGFRARPVRAPAALLEQPLARTARTAKSILTTRELGGVWHLPRAADEVPFIERTRARRWLPLRASVNGECRIGSAEHQGRTVDVLLAPDVLDRHMLLVARTRRGKSSLMLRLAQEMLHRTERRGLVLIDPHRDLAEALLGLIPAERAADVVFVDAADISRPVGLNVLDVGLDWPRDQAVATALSVFRSEWGDRFWGPRMEDAFRFALLSLFEANIALCATDPQHGRAAQYTLLDIPPLLTLPAFRQQVLRGVADPAVRAWWSGYYDPLERRFQAEIANPVLTKIHRFDGSRAARAIVGQPRSTIDPHAWVRDGSTVIVSTARGSIGENVAGLIGGTLLNLVGMAVARQSSLQPAQRRRVSLFVDEFHTIPGADYELILSELAKYGANLVLATQSLARLLSVGGAEGHGLRATVFANIDALFAFNCSAEDAEYLVPELGGALDVQDLVELGEHQCYARIFSSGERLPTFSVNLDPPSKTDPALRARLADVSARRYGRPIAEVEADRRMALARVELARGAHTLAAPLPEAGLTQPATSGEVERLTKPPRNEHRTRKHHKDQQPAHV